MRTAAAEPEAGMVGSVLFYADRPRRVQAWGGGHVWPSLGVYNALPLTTAAAAQRLLDLCQRFGSAGDAAAGGPAERGLLHVLRGCRALPARTAGGLAASRCCRHGDPSSRRRQQQWRGTPARAGESHRGIWTETDRQARPMATCRQGDLSCRQTRPALGAWTMGRSPRRLVRLSRVLK